MTYSLLIDQGSLIYMGFREKIHAPGVGILVLDFRVTVFWMLVSHHCLRIFGSHIDGGNSPSYATIPLSQIMVIEGAVLWGIESVLSL